MIFIFTLGITPKKTLHTWFANHKDYNSSLPAGTSQQLTKGGFNCKCDNLVAESHFTSSNNFITINVHLVYSYFSSFISPVLSTSVFHNSLRGPPLNF